MAPRGDSDDLLECLDMFCIDAFAKQKRFGCFVQRSARCVTGGKDVAGHRVQQIDSALSFSLSMHQVVADFPMYRLFRATTCRANISRPSVWLHSMFNQCQFGHVIYI